MVVINFVNYINNSVGRSLRHLESQVKQLTKVSCKCNLLLLLFLLL